MAASFILMTSMHNPNYAGRPCQPDSWARITELSIKTPEDTARHTKESKKFRFRTSLNRVASFDSKNFSETRSSDESISVLKASAIVEHGKKRGRFSRLKSAYKRVRSGLRRISTADKSRTSPPTSNVEVIDPAHKSDDGQALGPRRGTLLSGGQQRYRTPKRLFDLPAEVLLVITDSLPTSSAAALLLCCRTILNKLGNKKILQINSALAEPYTEWFSSSRETPSPSPEDSERQTFLELLDRDSSELIYCYFCKKLHKSELTNSWRNGPYIYIPERRPCAIVQARQRPSFYMDEYFNFSQVQNIMKHHRVGRETSLLLKQMERTYTIYKRQYAYQRSTHFRISPSGHFLARTQHWIALKGNAKQPPVLPEFCMIELCPHLSFYGSTASPPKWTSKSGASYLTSAPASPALTPSASATE